MRQCDTRRGSGRVTGLERAAEHGEQEDVQVHHDEEELADEDELGEEAEEGDEEEEPAAEEPGGVQLLRVVREPAACDRQCNRQTPSRARCADGTQGVVRVR